jgi:hypothetical protein
LNYKVIKNYFIIQLWANSRDIEDPGGPDGILFTRSLSSASFPTGANDTQITYLRWMSELTLGEALRAYLRHSPFRHKMNEYRVQALWEKEMGATIARYTDSVKLIQERLIITTSVAPLKQELSFSKEKIRDRMNEALGERLIGEVIIK